MLLDITLGTRTSWKILLVLSEAPGKAVSRKEIKALTKLGNKVLSKFLLLLECSEVITSNKLGKAYYYKLNMNNKFVEKILELIKLEKYHLNSQDFVILNILRDFVYELTNLNLDNLERVILFGSYAKRTYTNNSDVDIAIILKEKSPDYELLVIDITDRLKKRYKKVIQPHYYTSEEFKEIKNNLVKDIIKDGIILF